MIILDTTTKSLELILSGSVTTNQLPISVSYVDMTTSPTFIPGATDTISNNTSTVTIISAPASSTYRQIKHISIFNADTVDAIVTIQLNDNSTLRKIVKISLNSGDTLHYLDHMGFFVTDSTGATKISGSSNLLATSNIWAALNTFSIAPVITPFNSAGFVKNNSSGTLSSSPVTLSKQLGFSDLTSATTYSIDSYATFAYTINGVKKIKTSSGTVTVAIKINGTDITNLSAIAVTSTPQNVAASGANTVAIGDAVTFVISSLSSATNFEFTLDATRTS